MAKEEKKQAKPKEGEKTREQLTLGGVASFLGGEFTGFGKPPYGHYSTYRKMRGNPTIALARAVATAPIRTAMWSVSSDDGVPDDNVAFIDKQIRRLWPKLIHHVLRALDYGWMPFEKVWKVDEYGRYVYHKLKPLLVDSTVIQIEGDTGGFAGLDQKGIRLGPENCFVFTYDEEAGDFYGRSRHENIRANAWHQWEEISKKRGQYAGKVAGIIPMVEYPEGESRNRDGAVKSNFDLATALLRELGSGKGVAMPNTMSKWAGDLARSGIDIAQLKAWHISFLESKGAHSKGFTDTLRHLESLMMRGWLVPERAATEGQYGTKAESESQAELALVIADLLFADILREVNAHVINPLLKYNFGNGDVDTIRLERGGIDPLLKMFFRDITKKVLGEPANIDLFIKWLDIDAMLDNVGLPKSQAHVESLNEEEAASAKKRRSSGAIEQFVSGVYRRYGDSLRYLT